MGEELHSVLSGKTEPDANLWAKTTEERKSGTKKNGRCIAERVIMPSARVRSPFRIFLASIEVCTL